MLLSEINLKDLIFKICLFISNPCKTSSKGTEISNLKAGRIMQLYGSTIAISVDIGNAVNIQL